MLDAIDLYSRALNIFSKSWLDAYIFAKEYINTRGPSSWRVKQACWLGWDQSGQCLKELVQNSVTLANWSPSQTQSASKVRSSGS